MKNNKKLFCKINYIIYQISYSVHITAVMLIMLVILHFSVYVIVINILLDFKYIINCLEITHYNILHIVHIYTCY